MTNNRNNQNDDKKKTHPLIEIDQVIHAKARLIIMTYLYVVEGVDFIFLMNMTGLTWGNLSSHLSKLEKAGYIVIEKGFKGKKPYTMIHLSEKGRSAFKEYQKNMKEFFNNLLK